jgi:hypothetical protein
MHAPMMLLSTHHVRLDVHRVVFNLVNLVQPMLFLLLIENLRPEQMVLQEFYSRHSKGQSPFL